MSMQQAPDLRLYFDLADRMRRAMRVSGTSVQQVADELEVSRNTISAWINGRGFPRRRDLRDFALLTGFPMSWLETGMETPPSDDGGGVVRPEGLEPPTFCFVVNDERLAA